MKDFENELRAVENYVAEAMLILDEAVKEARKQQREAEAKEHACWVKVDKLENAWMETKDEEIGKRLDEAYDEYREAWEVRQECDDWYDVLTSKQDRLS